MGLIPQSPHGQSPNGPPDPHLASLAVPLHTALCPVPSHPKPLGSWQRSLQWAGEPRASPCCQGANVAVTLHGYPPGMAPSLAPSLCVCAEPLHPMGGWETRGLGRQPTPGRGEQLLPSALGRAAGWHRAQLLCCEQNKTARRFLLLSPLHNPKLKQDFSNHKVPLGRELRASSFERGGQRGVRGMGPALCPPPQQVV